MHATEMSLYVGKDKFSDNGNEYNFAAVQYCYYITFAKVLQSINSL